MGFFTRNIFTAKQMKSEDTKHSPVMQKLLGNKDIARVLDKKPEREKFLRNLRTRSSNDGVDLNDIRTTLGDFRKGHDNDISGKEAQQLASAFKEEGFIPKQNKSYIFKPEEKKAAVNPPSFSREANQSNINSQNQPPVRTAFSSSNLKKMDSKLSGIVHTADRH